MIDQGPDWLLWSSPVLKNFGPDQLQSSPVLVFWQSQDWTFKHYQQSAFLWPFLWQLKHSISLSDLFFPPQSLLSAKNMASAFFSLVSDLVDQQSYLLMIVCIKSSGFNSCLRTVAVAVTAEIN